MQHILLSKINTKPTTNLHLIEDFHKWSEVLPIFEGGPVAFDWETTGLSAIKDKVVTVGLANTWGAVSIKLKSDFERKYICEWLANQQLIAHNYMFDGAFLGKVLGRVVPALADTLIMFKTLSNEGFMGQKWSLKYAMTDILGWDEVNNTEVQAYMAEHLVAMHNVPFEILGKYNALDADATFKLWQYLSSVANNHTGVYDYWSTEWRTLLCLLIEQHLGGLPVDVLYYQRYYAEKKELMDSQYAEFIKHVADHINDYNTKAHSAQYPSLSVDQVYKKDGSYKKNYLKRQEQEERDRYHMYFNIDSNKDLCWLFYNQLGYDIKKTTPKGEPSIDKTVLHLFGDHGKRLKVYRKTRDEIKFIKQILDDQHKGVVYANIKPHATITGRCGSGQEEASL